MRKNILLCVIMLTGSVQGMNEYQRSVLRNIEKRSLQVQSVYKLKPLYDELNSIDVRGGFCDIKKEKVIQLRTFMEGYMSFLFAKLTPQSKFNYFEYRLCQVKSVQDVEVLDVEFNKARSTLVGCNTRLVAGFQGKIDKTMEHMKVMAYLARNKGK
jgi:hypothetical protein